MMRPRPIRCFGLLICIAWALAIPRTADAQSAPLAAVIDEADCVSSIRSALYDSESDRVLVVAHRGAWREAPENSLFAIEMAIELGVDIVELDIRRTRDGRFILMHDETLDRTTTAAGRVADHALADLRGAHLLNGLGRPTHHLIPTLEEAVETVRGRAMINIDKAYRHTREIYDILRRLEAVDHVLFKGNVSREELVREFGDLLGDLSFMPVIDLDESDAEQRVDEYLRQVHLPVAFEFIFSRGDSPVLDRIDQIKAAGARVWVNTLWPSLNAGHDDDTAVYNLAGSYDWVITQGFNLIQTDRPRLLINYLRDHQLR